MLYMFGSRRQVLNLNGIGTKEITMNAMNCRIFIEGCKDCSTGTLDLDYRTSIYNIFKKVWAREKTYFYTEDANKFDYSVFHYDDILGCNLKLIIP